MNEGPQLRLGRASALAVGERLEQFGGGRVCGNVSCSTRLSTYNPSQMCAAHRGWREEEQPRRRRRSTAA